MKKWNVMLMAGLLLTMLGGGVASAHVTVQPPTVVQGSYEKFAVRVPSEDKESPTVKIEIKFPMDTVTISRFEPKPGWNYELAKDATNKITGVTWTATGEGLSPTEFSDFFMQGKVADNATEIVWKAYQTYKNGTIVEWVGASGAEKPASVTKVTPIPTGAASTDSHGATAAPAAGGAAPASTVANPALSAPAPSQTPLYLSLVALALGVIAIFIALSKRKTNR
ncbi:YcnI family copper-binding membrane protein [Paenibacillus agricola]|uniref:YcnI family protein n=1 Tax=Paenibacillus agricola TaxID=2716264 RepID=A0ABX0J3E9_9BACL|nr:YcnI family protein [Paenibacillus agricola]NHN30183.1 YcnI family protein [Paenibacillus agricola]